jgi:hypothetical protein
MTQASLSKRRAQGEDSIYWDESKNRYIGAVSLGFSLAGTRIRKTLTWRPSGPTSPTSPTSPNSAEHSASAEYPGDHSCPDTPLKPDLP